MSEQKLVSVAMPVYNGADQIRRQLDSIYNQTYKNLEVVICDDCSQDNTVEILEEYKQKYGLKYLVNEKNMGRNVSYERAARHTTGEYIALADHDDAWLAEKIETQINNIGDYSLITSDAILVDQDDNVIAKSFRKHSGIFVPEKDFFKFFVYHNYVSGHALMIKRDILDLVFPVPEKFIEADWWLGLVASRNGGVKYLKKPLVKYRQHLANNVGAGKAPIKLWDKLLDAAAYFGEAKVKHRQKKYAISKNNAQAMLESPVLNLTDEEKNYLYDAIKYFDAMMGQGGGIDTMFFAYENRDIIYCKKEIFRKFLSVALFLPYLAYRTLPNTTSNSKSFLK